MFTHGPTVSKLYITADVQPLQPVNQADRSLFCLGHWPTITTQKSPATPAKWAWQTLVQSALIRQEAVNEAYWPIIRLTTAVQCSSAPNRAHGHKPTLCACFLSSSLALQNRKTISQNQCNAKLYFSIIHRIRYIQVTLNSYLLKAWRV